MNYYQNKQSNTGYQNKNAIIIAQPSERKSPVMHFIKAPFPVQYALRYCHQ